METLSDITETPTVTSTMTPASSTSSKAAQRKKKPNKPKNGPKKARKLEPYHPKPPPIAAQSHMSQTTPKQIFNLSGIVTPNEPSSSDISQLDELHMTQIDTIIEEDSWDNDFSGTQRTSNIAVKTVKEPLNINKSSYIEDYMPTDVDIDSLADIDGSYPCILPYPGPIDFDT